MSRIFSRILLTIVLLLLVEAYLRYGLNPGFVLDDIVLFTLPKNGRYIRGKFGANGAAKIVVRTNSMRYRGKELIPKDNNKRVLVYGDSFILSDFLNEEHIFCKQLQNKIRTDIAQNVEVVNAGVAGYGPDQISLNMSGELKVFDPDLVVVAIYSGNDFGDLLRNKIYKINERQELEKNNYVLNRGFVEKYHNGLSGGGEIRLVIFLKIFLRAFPGEIVNEVPNRLISYKKIRNALLSVTDRIVDNIFTKPETPEYNILPALRTYIDDSIRMSYNAYDEFIEKEDNSVKFPFLDHYDADIAIFPEKKSSQYKVKLMSEVLLQISRTLDDAKVPHLFLFIPSPIDVCDNYDCRVDKGKFPSYKPSRLTDVLEEIAVRNKLNYVNLYGYFDKADPDALYFRDGNVHWNKKGQKLAADIMVEFIEEKKLLQENKFKYE